jgi:hypothetical protein
MPKRLNVDWPAVRVLAVALGVREAARQMGISEDAVRQRSKREAWMASPETVAQRALAKPVTSVSPNALSPAHALVNVLQEHERETKLSLARSARRMAKDAEQATLRESYTRQRKLHPLPTVGETRTRTRTRSLISAY